MPAWQPYVIYGGITLFWTVVFVVAVVLTRRSLRGVGDPVPDPDETERALHAGAGEPAAADGAQQHGTAPSRAGGAG